MINLLVNNFYEFQHTEFDAVRAQGYEIDFIEKGQTADDLDLSQYEVGLIDGAFVRNNYARLDSLKVVHLSAAGFDTFPFETVAGSDLIVLSARGLYSKPMAEWVVLKALEIYRDARAFENQQNTKVWHWSGSAQCSEIYGKVVGTLGTGDVALEVLHKMNAFGATVIGLNTNGRSVEGFEKVCAVSELGSFLQECDIVVNCLPKTKQTIGLIRREQLMQMKPDAVLLNISRGEIIDESDLAQLLKEGHLRGAAFDCFSIEPLPEQSPLWDIPNFYITPHYSWITEGLKPRLLDLYIDNLTRYANGEPLLNRVDLSRGY